MFNPPNNTTGRDVGMGLGAGVTRLGMGLGAGVTRLVQSRIIEAFLALRLLAATALFKS